VVGITGTIPASISAFTSLCKLSYSWHERNSLLFLLASPTSLDAFSRVDAKRDFYDRQRTKRNRHVNKSGYVVNSILV
jgi:hypothetical protein